MKILVTGADGQIGWELARILPGLGSVTALDRGGLDLARPESIRSAVRRVEPDVIVNAGGYTAVDRAEEEAELATAVNGVGPEVLAEEARRLGAAVVHYSSDYVFDGTKGAPYAPGDATNPLSVYGRSKLAGEEAVTASGASSVILRTAWVFGTRRPNFLRTILERARAGDTLRVIDDRFGSPTWCRRIAEATAEIIRRGVTRTDAGWSFGERAGVYHLTGGGVATWYAFARCIVESAGIAATGAVLPVPADERPAPAPRPAYSVLDCTRTREVFGVEMGPWAEAVTEAVHELA